MVEIATENLAALPADWVHEYFGMAVPASVFGRAWLIMSLAELGRFAEAAKYEAEAIQLAEPTQHAHTIGWAHLAASMLHLFKGDWAKARSLVEHWMNMPADCRSRRPSSLGGRLLRLGAGADRRGERGVEPGARGRGAPRASGGEGNCRSSRLGLPRVEPRLSAARPARRGAAPGLLARSNPLSASPASRPMRCTCWAT